MKRNRKTKSAGQLRNATGASAVELVCAFVALVPVALFAVNIGYLALATFINDAACREAARTAAEQRNADAAYGAALAAVQAFKIAGGLAGSPQVVQLQFEYSPNPDEPDLPLKMRDLKLTPTDNLAMAPFVAVTTRLNVGLPAPMFLGPNGIGNDLDLISSYSFPVLNGIDSDPNAPDIIGPEDETEASGSGDSQVDD